MTLAHRVKVSAALHKWGDWIRMGLTILCFLGFQMFDNRYVARADYESDSKVLTQSLETVRVALAVQETQMKTLGDHESRLRVLERVPVRTGFGAGAESEIGEAAVFSLR